jgi:hypothetical protein
VEADAVSIYDDVMAYIADGQLYTAPEIAEALGHPRANVDHALRMGAKYGITERKGETRLHGQRTNLWGLVRWWRF